MTPSRLLLGLVAVVLLIGAAEFLLRLFGNPLSLALLWWVGVAVVAIAAAIDLLLSWWPAKLTIQRELPHSLAQGNWQDVTVTVLNTDRRVLRADLLDGVPDAFNVRDLPCTFHLRAGEQAQLTYALYPVERGDFQFAAMRLRRRSVLALWQLQQAAPVPGRMRIFPDFSWLKGSLLLVGEQRMSRMGVRLVPRRGEGMEFHQLREYRASDSQRQIDWKASARRAHLISREYQDERDQQILMVLDTGSRMRAMDGAMSHFDHVLRAMLLLAVVALRQGDSVGLLSFGGVSRWLSMQRGAAAVNRLLNGVYDLQTGTGASDYLAAAQEIRVRQRRRALVVFLTNAREEDQDLLPALELLRGRHVVLVTSLREAVLGEIEHLPIKGLDDALRYASASAELQARARISETVQRGGHALLDCMPQELPVRLVRDYWQLKRSGRL